MVGISLEEAVKIIKEAVTPLHDLEKLPLCGANGRILAQDIYAPLSNPPFDRSPLDGYAFKASSSKEASKEQPVYLRVVGEVCAGAYYERDVQEGEAVRIMTGAPIPKGCDCVLRQEDTDEGNLQVAIYKSLKPYDNYCFAGEDIKRGTLLLKKGEKLSPITLGILASMGIKEVEVRKPLKMALLCTGDELMPLGEPLKPGKIYSTNEVMLLTRAQELGVEVKVLSMSQDTPQLITEMIKRHIDEVDVVITTGGVSVGKKDMMHEVLPMLGATRLFWRIAMQPGTPVLAGQYKEKLIIGLSGNPFAALANFELLVRPLLSYLSGNPHLMPIITTGVMASSFNKISKKRRFIRASYEQGKVSLNHSNHSSGSLYTMSLCNALIDIPAGTSGLHIGDKVKVILI